MNKNLVQISMMPEGFGDLRLPAFSPLRKSELNHTLVFDETLWLSLPPKQGICPDCGGTGNLRDAMGTIRDTRLLPKNSAPYCSAK
ncbi:MAG: hypothetical protein R3C11_01390 [Planctomycetaceae bacterium]